VLLAGRLARGFGDVLMVAAVRETFERIHIGQDIVAFIDHHGVKSVSMVDRIIGCPHQEGIDYDGDWCPVCDFWKGRDRFTGKLIGVG